jgi:CHAD domain-containing protein
MAQQLASQLFLVQSNRIRRQLGKLRKHASPLNLHRIRVAVKKMDTLVVCYICFLQPAHAEVFANWFAKLRPLYKKVGRIRSLQLFLLSGERIGLWDKQPDAKTFLSDELHRKSEQLGGFLRTFRYPSHRKLTAVLEKYNSYHAPHLGLIAQDLTIRQQREAMAILSLPPNEQWHAARRLLKSNYLLSRMLSSANIPFDAAMETVWAQLGESIGEWHDWQTFSGTMAKFPMVVEDDCIKRQLLLVEDKVTQLAVLLLEDKRASTF